MKDLIMKEIIYADAETSLTAYFGRPSYETEERLRSSAERFSSRLLDSAGHIARRARDQVHEFTRGEFARRVSRVRNKVDNIFQGDSIMYLDDIGAIQNANALMRTHIMEHPELRRRVNDNRADGYSDNYVAENPNKIGRYSHGYRNITDGFTVDEGEGIVIRQYFEAIKPEHRMMLSDKAAIDKTHRTVTALLKAGLHDPSDTENGLLG